MTIQVGDKLPEAKFRVMTAEGPQVKTTDDIFKGKKVALFAVPGAYTGTCHKMHLPSIFLNAYAIKNKGVDTIAIVSVNDAFVMNAWKRDTDQRGIAFGPRAEAEARGVEIHADLLGELGIAVGQEQHLLPAARRLVPCCEHERIVDGDAYDSVDTVLLEVVGALDEAR